MASTNNPTVVENGPTAKKVSLMVGQKIKSTKISKSVPKQEVIKADAGKQQRPSRRELKRPQSPQIQHDEKKERRPVVPIILLGIVVILVVVVLMVYEITRKYD